MKHRKQGLQTLLLLIMGVAFTTGLYGQSLADLARRTRSGQSGGRVLTNDDVSTSTPAAAGATGQAVAGQPDQPADGQAAAGQPDQPADGQPAAGQPDAEDAPAEKTPAELEAEYRERFAELRENLSLEERKLDILQRELNLMQQQYYSDPAATLMQEQSRSDINNRVAEIEMQTGVVEMARQAIADLEEELRVKGLPPGWAR